MNKSKSPKPESASDTKSSTPTFAAELKAARLKKNWSLRDVEKRMGGNISRQTVLRAEQGDVGLDTLFSLLNLYSFTKAAKDAVLEAFNAHRVAQAKANAA